MTKKDDYFIICGLILLFIIPELNSVHYDPLPQFWAEITVAWAVVLLFLIVCWRQPKIYIPSISLGCLLFASYLTLQISITNIDFHGLNYTASLELFLMMFLSITICTLKESYGLDYIAIRIAIILLIGSLLQSFIGILQFSGQYKLFGDLIFYDSLHPTSNIFGHFGQRNHYAHYLSWGSFSLIYLKYKAKISHKAYCVLLLWLGFSLMLSSSRSVLLYFIANTILFAIWHYKNQTINSKRFFYLVLLASVTIVSIQLVDYFINMIMQNKFASGLERVIFYHTERRSVEWMKAWLIFQEHKLFGIGWNGYAQAGVALHYLFPQAPPNDGLFTNCHNLILQLLAETGLVGVLIVSMSFAVAIYRLTHSSDSHTKLFFLSLITITLIHSMNEYPLWYMYFLAGLITFLAIESPIIQCSKRVIVSISAPFIVIYLYLMIASSLTFAHLVLIYDPPENRNLFAKNVLYLQNMSNHDNSLWRYVAIFTIDNYIEVDSNISNSAFPLTAQLEYIRKLNMFHPYPDTLLKEAMLENNLHDTAAAQASLHVALSAFPVYKLSYQLKLKDVKYQTLLNQTK